MKLITNILKKYRSTKLAKRLIKMDDSLEYDILVRMLQNNNIRYQIEQIIAKSQNCSPIQSYFVFSNMETVKSLYLKYKGDII